MYIDLIASDCENISSSFHLPQQSLFRWSHLQSILIDRFQTRLIIRIANASESNKKIQENE